MSARDWQPGDVAHYDGLRVMLTREEWMDSDGDWRDGEAWTESRPLAVIDPEAPIPDEWVRVAESAWCASCNAPSPNGNRHVESDDFRAALAALFAHIATPREPKPDEPTGDRATVRDRGGALWTRQNAMGGARPWFSPLADGGGWRDWSDLDVPADGVLFGGVQ